ncbi:MAG: hypothetical protein ACM336_04785 [Acidobacteriota bacterium]
MNRGTKALTFLVGAGSGAALMYMLDPDRGRRRRKFVRDKAVATWSTAQETVRKTSRDIGNRAQGVAASTRSVFKREGRRDNLVERVRSRIGRVVSHPHAIEITERDGRISVSGPILTNEVSHLLRAIRSVKGVHYVENRLDVHDTAENVPLLQGGRSRRSREGSGPGGWKTAAQMAGGALAAYSLARRRDALGRTIWRVVHLAA